LISVIVGLIVLLRVFANTEAIGAGLITENGSGRFVVGNFNAADVNYSFNVEDGSLSLVVSSPRMGFQWPMADLVVYLPINAEIGHIDYLRIREPIFLEIFGGSFGDASIAAEFVNVYDANFEGRLYIVGRRSVVMRNVSFNQNTANIRAYRWGVDIQ